jgi:hypothetical protein
MGPNVSKVEIPSYQRRFCVACMKSNLCVAACSQPDIPDVFCGVTEILEESQS